jgi:hypothetical protein
MRCLGAGTRVKKVLFFNAKVYSLTIYVDGGRCAKELGIRSRGGFFQSDDDFSEALLDGAFDKALVVRTCIAPAGLEYVICRYGPCYQTWSAGPPACVALMSRPRMPWGMSLPAGSCA